jgi:tripartite ATP-independent transporter DctM subunit
MTLCVLAGVFLLLFFSGMPVSVAVGASAFAAMLCSLPWDAAATAGAHRMATSLTSFTLLAIPFFILAGNLIGRGGLARRLIGFARVVAWPVPGALALANVFSCMLFGAVSGSASACTSAIGSFMIPEMEKDRYDRRFSAALTVAASGCGLLIPPSNALIVYAMVAGGVSISALFVAGYIPGILLGLSLVPGALAVTIRKGYGTKVPRPTMREFGRATMAVLPSLGMIVLVVGGMVAGAFTATEGAVVAVVYAFVLAVFVYREVRWSEVPDILVQTAATTGVVFLMIGTSMAMAWVFAYADVPRLLEGALQAITTNPYAMMLLINAILLLFGTFLDLTPAVLIFTPIFLPIMLRMAGGMGLSEDRMKYLFGIVMVFNNVIGLSTPPLGSTLFIGCGIAKIGLSEITKPLLPMFGAMILALLAVSFVPSLSLWLPGVLGLIR